ncbi:uncharacterized protein LOC110919073 [Helianthus annuus]|uniref:uncharacterized protein LOC110919073 n=1 Tax=Helianthus annuus TaxID=4232 RepID=UPI000B8FDA78|nr:uncharacterized protein LOC110919073 [Helianthus annuus]
MEILNNIMSRAVSEGLFEGLQLPNGGPLLSHLLYADDAIFVGTWSRANLLSLNRILRIFSLLTILKVNLGKSRVFGIGACDFEVRDFASILNCHRGSFPFIYLGIPVGVNIRWVVNWKPVIDKFNSKLSTWKAKVLYLARRITLTKAVHGSDLEKDFLKYGFNIHSLLHCEIAYGDFACFLLDNWTGVGLLYDLFPSIFYLAGQKKIKVQDCYELVGSTLLWRWGWKRDPSSAQEWAECSLLMALLSQQKVKAGLDTWGWKGCSVYAFKVKSVRRELCEAKGNTFQNFDFIWNSWVPPKVNILVWRAIIRRLATKKALSRRGLQVRKTLCSMCHVVEEDVAMFSFHAQALEKCGCRF